MQTSIVANTQLIGFSEPPPCRFIGCQALIASLAPFAIPVSHAAVCSMDIDGNGCVEATDGMLMMRYILGMHL